MSFSSFFYHHKKINKHRVRYKSCNDIIPNNGIRFFSLCVWERKVWIVKCAPYSHIIFVDYSSFHGLQFIYVVMIFMGLWNIWKRGKSLAKSRSNNEDESKWKCIKNEYSRWEISQGGCMNDVDSMQKECALCALLHALQQFIFNEHLEHLCALQKTNERRNEKLRTESPNARILVRFLCCFFRYFVFLLQPDTPHFFFSKSNSVDAHQICNFAIIKQCVLHRLFPVRKP